MSVEVAVQTIDVAFHLDGVVFEGRVRADVDCGRVTLAVDRTGGRVDSVSGKQNFDLVEICSRKTQSASSACSASHRAAKLVRVAQQANGFGKLTFDQQVSNALEEIDFVGVIDRRDDRR